MMSFEEFKDSVVENIKEYLPEKYENADVVLSTITKNNDTQFTSISISSEDSKTFPNVYLDEFYEAYEHGVDFDDIVRKLADVYSRNDNIEFDANDLMDYESIKDKITCKLISAENNSEYLSNKPHTNIEDLAVAYSIVLGTEDNAVCSVMIDNKMLDNYGISVEELHNVAISNLSDQDYSFKTMMETIMESMFPAGFPVNDPLLSAMLPSEADFPNMYVLTNGTGVHGASEILNPKIMDEISDKLGGDFVVLPSSVHETMILPMSEVSDRETLENIVQEANVGCVKPSDRLSDHVYQYDSKNHELVRMDKMEEREQSKETVKETKSQDRSEEKSSLMDRISKKQNEINSRDSANSHIQHSHDEIGR